MFIFRNNGFLKSAIIIYAFQALNLLFPLILIPTLSHRLTTYDLGSFYTLQALSSTLALVLEYGFMFSGSREVSEKRTVEHIDVVNGITSAKLILSLIILVFLGIYFYSFGNFKGIEGVYAFFGVLVYALGVGFSPSWYYQGINKLMNSFVLETIFKILPIVVIFFVRDFNRSSIIFLILSLGPLLSTLLLHFPLLKNGKPSINISWGFYYLSKELNSFLYRAITSLYTTINIFLLSFIAHRSDIGAYGMAEKLIATLSGVFWPIWRLLSPYAIRLRNSDNLKFRKFIILVSILLCAMGILMILSLHFMQEIVLKLLNGNLVSLKLLHSLSYNIILVAITGTLGLLYFVPEHKERFLNIISLVAGVLNIFIIVFGFSKKGIDIAPLAVIFSEMIVMVFMLYFIIYSERRKQ